MTTLHSFNSTDGAWPSGGLIQGSDGNFYGTTSSGGAAGFGAIFKLNAAGTLTTLHSFNSSNGASPFGRLIEGSDGHFYGTTQSGGAAGLGTIFKMDSAGTLTTLHSFNGGDGAYPRTGLIQGSDGSFYGTTGSGGVAAPFPASGYGTIFKIDAAGTLTTLHRFNKTDGYGPEGELIQGSDGSFYGTTAYGGASSDPMGLGTIFRVDAAGTLTSLHSFVGSDGAGPLAALIQAGDGSFYGTTFVGGANSGGAIFRFTVPTPTSTTMTVSPSPSMVYQPVTLTAKCDSQQRHANRFCRVFVFLFRRIGPHLVLQRSSMERPGSPPQPSPAAHVPFAPSSGAPALLRRARLPS